MYHTKLIDLRKRKSRDRTADWYKIENATASQYYVNICSRSFLDVYTTADFI